MQFRKIMTSLGAVVAALTVTTSAQATWLQYVFKFSGWTHWVDNVDGGEGDLFVRYGLYVNFSDDENWPSEESFWSFRGPWTFSNTLASFKADYYGGEEVVTIQMPYSSGFMGEIVDPAASYFKWQSDGYTSYSDIEGTLDFFSRKETEAKPQYGDYWIYATVGYGELPPPSVPEPASWVMMIGGFGMVGAALRRRKARYAVTFG